MNKKAIVFSLIAILMSSLFILIYSIFVHVSLDEESKIDISKIQKTEYFLELFPKYFESSIQQTSYIALNYLTQQVPLTNFTEEFISCLQTGQDIEGNNCSLDGNSSDLTELLFNISNQASKIYRANCSIYLSNVNITQVEPFYLKVSANGILYFQRGDDLTWEREYFVSKKISLSGLNDPLYKFNTTTSNEDRIIKEYKSAFSPDSFEGNSTLFKKFVEEGFYFVDSSTPSFIDIMEGKIYEGEFNTGLGINSIMPIFFKNGLSSYHINRSSLSYDYIIGNYTDMSELVLINEENLQKTNLTFKRYELFPDMGFDGNQLKDATACNCNYVGCSC